MEGVAFGAPEAPSERVERLTETCPGCRLHGAAPEQACQLVSGVRLTGWHRQITKEGLRLSRRKGEGSAGIEVGSKAAQERQSEPRHHRLGGLTIARVSTPAASHVAPAHTSQSAWP